MKLNVGVSRKVGEPNYGSRGASINLELEVDQSLIEHPSRLKQRIQKLFALARAAVDDQLAARRTDGNNCSGQLNRQPATAAPATGQQPTNQSQPTTSSTPGPLPRPATAAQLRALRSIAARRTLNLEQITRDQFGCRPDQLTLPQASSLIDQLKSAR
jgi:hypothetical protein